MTNGKKAFIWFILCVVLFSLGKYGKSCFYNGYGSIGSIRYNLLPISEEILRVDYIIRYGGITATYEEDKIVVKANNKEYINLYSKESGLQYITNSFDADDEVGQLVAKCIIDAVYRYHTKGKTVFGVHNLYSFLSIDAADAANLAVNEQYTIKINVNSNIIDALPKVN